MVDIKQENINVTTNNDNNLNNDLFNIGCYNFKKASANSIDAYTIDPTDQTTNIPFMVHGINWTASGDQSVIIKSMNIKK